MVVPEARQTTFNKAVAREAPQQAAKLYGANALRRNDAENDTRKRI